MVHGVLKDRLTEIDFRLRCLDRQSTDLKIGARIATPSDPPRERHGFWKRYEDQRGFIFDRRREGEIYSRLLHSLWVIHHERLQQVDLPFVTDIFIHFIYRKYSKVCLRFVIAYCFDDISPGEAVDFILA